MSKLIDVFLFDGAHEHDMLNLRYLTLREHVDAMVAVSCNLTHQGAPNPCEPPPNGLDLVWCVVMAENFPEGQVSQWGAPYWCWIEAQHRNLIVEQLPCCLAAHGIELDRQDDYVMLSDLDEIPDPRYFAEIKAGVNLYGKVSIPQRMHGFAIDYLYPNRWVGTTVSKFGDMRPQEDRESRYQGLLLGNGWHFSWFGDVETKQRKARSFSHGELANLDVAHCYEEAIHANGEQLIRLTDEQLHEMSWPEPMYGIGGPASLGYPMKTILGSFSEFDIPASWFSPVDDLARMGSRHGG